MNKKKNHLFVGLQHQPECGNLLSLGTEQRLQFEYLLHAQLFVLVHHRCKLSGCSPLLGQLQRTVNSPLEVFDLVSDDGVQVVNIHGLLPQVPTRLWRRWRWASRDADAWGACEAAGGAAMAGWRVSCVGRGLIVMGVFGWGVHGAAQGLGGAGRRYCSEASRQTRREQSPRVV